MENETVLMKATKPTIVKISDCWSIISSLEFSGDMRGKTPILETCVEINHIVVQQCCTTIP